MSRFAAAAAAVGVQLEIRSYPAGTRTAADAAAAIGCDVAQICKSLVFRGADSGRAVLVVSSGVNRVDEDAVGALLGEPLAKADADFVRAATGYAIGGVPPFAHPEPLWTVVDEDLLRHDVVHAAAGTPRDNFAIAPDRLAELCGGRVARVSAASGS
jgi:prolyl-tRNA editing enzyme YbaK/EbsC (Cys-tRNA(Pro) deacylase)